MAETCDQSDCDLSYLRMFDGLDFAAWRECMLRALTHRGLHRPLSGDAGRPCGMSDDQWHDLEEMAFSTIRLRLAETVYALVMYEPTTRALWQRLHEMYDGVESSRTRVRQRRSRSHREVVCWHCGHSGHMRRHCFRCMRQRRRHGCLHADIAVDLTVTGADSVSHYTSDGDVTFASVFSPGAHMLDTLPSQWLLDADATFHVTSCRE